MGILLIVINTTERVLLKSHLNIIFFSNPQTGVDGSRCGTPVLMQLQPEAKKVVVVVTKTQQKNVTGPIIEPANTWFTYDLLPTALGNLAVTKVFSLILYTCVKME